MQVLRWLAAPLAATIAVGCGGGSHRSYIPKPAPPLHAAVPLTLDAFTVDGGDEQICVRLPDDSLSHQICLHAGRPVFYSVASVLSVHAGRDVVFGFAGPRVVSVAVRSAAGVSGAMRPRTVTIAGERVRFFALSLPASGGVTLRARDRLGRAHGDTGMRYRLTS